MGPSALLLQHGNADGASPRIRNARSPRREQNAARITGSSRLSGADRCQADADLSIGIPATQLMLGASGAYSRAYCRGEVPVASAFIDFEQRSDRVSKRDLVGIPGLPAVADPPAGSVGNYQHLTRAVAVVGKIAVKTRWLMSTAPSAHPAPSLLRVRCEALVGIAIGVGDRCGGYHAEGRDVPGQVVR